MLVAAVGEVAEEDGVDRRVVGLCQELDDAIRRGVELGGRDRELLLGPGAVGQRTAEVLGEGLVEARLALAVVLVDLLQFLEAQILRPGPVVERLGGDVPRSAVTAWVRGRGRVLRRRGRGGR